MSDIDECVRNVDAGVPGARDALFAAAYGDLQRLARARLRGGGRSTCIDTCVLVHESYLRCLNTTGLRPADRRAFFAYASRVMRSVIVDTVRERLTQRRGGDLRRTTLSTELLDNLPSDEAEVLDVHQALEQLALADERLAQVVELRYFGGYSETEIAAALGVTERTVRRDWEKARLLLGALLGS